MPRPKLSPRALRFVDEYLLDLCAKDAALRAGYGPKAAKRSGSRLLQDDRVQALIQQRMVKRSVRVEVKQDDVLRELLRFALLDVGEAFGDDGRLKSLKDMPEGVRRAIAGVEIEELFEGRGEDRKQVGWVRKVKFWDKPRGLELLGKHLGMFAEQLKVSATVTHVHRAQLLEKISSALDELTKPAALPAPVAQA